ncbi:hypothetical protein P389DRAFT_165795 [Cystobasidium minutum MCA 4210]|uniref:uncharacterized protein n=1 Tax=Cystobasidium minutum MCA 4210 TaxID=1397322 RepID=UPI0034CE2ECE|eukprot:jgi/Rhomi1/165795/fgenesh1_kg.1_\
MPTRDFFWDGWAKVVVTASDSIHDRKYPMRTTGCGWMGRVNDGWRRNLTQCVHQHWLHDECGNSSVRIMRPRSNSYIAHSTSPFRSAWSISGSDEHCIFNVKLAHLKREDVRTLLCFQCPMRPDYARLLAGSPLDHALRQQRAISSTIS